MRFLPIIQTILSILLIAAILLQSKGAGLGATFGGEGNVYSSRRGFEKTLFLTTIVLSILFLGTALLSIAL